jgi:HSP20 family protein
MHRLIKIRIMRDFDHLEERLRNWRDRWFELDEAAGAFRPPVDYYETPQGLVIKMEIAGVAPEDVSLTLTGQELVIRGHRRAQPPAGLTRFLHHEIIYGAFERSFLLPIPVDRQEVEAHYADGILTIHLPRSAPRTRRITVKELEQEDD